MHPYPRRSVVAAPKRVAGWHLGTAPSHRDHTLAGAAMNSCPNAAAVSGRPRTPTSCCAAEPPLGTTGGPPDGPPAADPPSRLPSTPVPAPTSAPIGPPSKPVAAPSRTGLERPPHHRVLRHEPPDVIERTAQPRQEIFRIVRGGLRTQQDAGRPRRAPRPTTQQDAAAMRTATWDSRSGNWACEPPGTAVTDRLRGWCAKHSHSPVTARGEAIARRAR
jgi:hypothetical protein